MADQFESSGEVGKSNVLEPGILTRNVELALEEIRNEPKTGEERDIYDVISEREKKLRQQSALRNRTRVPSNVMGVMPVDILHLRDVLRPLETAGAKKSDEVSVTFYNGKVDKFKVSELQRVHDEMVEKILKQYTTSYPTLGREGAKQKVLEQIQEYRRIRALEAEPEGIIAEFTPKPSGKAY